MHRRSDWSCPDSHVASGRIRLTCPPSGGIRGALRAGGSKLDALQRWFADPTVRRLVEVGAELVIIMALVHALSHRVGSAIRDTDARYRIRKAIAFLGYLAAAVASATVHSARLTGLTVAFGVAGAGIAFALREVISSVAGWVALTVSRFHRPRRPRAGGGITGDVIDIGVLRTTLLEIGEWVHGDDRVLARQVTTVPPASPGAGSAPPRPAGGGGRIG